jgi:sulfur carrier protein
MSEPDLENKITVQTPISLDGQSHAVAMGTTLSALLSTLDKLPQAVATSVNGVFVPRTQRESCVLQKGDAVLLFQPIVGG